MSQLAPTLDANQRAAPRMRTLIAAKISFNNGQSTLQRSAFNSTHEPTAPVSRSWFRLHARRSSTTAGVDEFWFCGSSVIVWRAAGVGVASPTRQERGQDRAALPRRDAR